MAKLVIRQWPLTLEIGRETILEAALAAEVPFPHGCRIGECGFCKTRLLSGEVTMAAYDQAVLTPAEREQGLILACRSRPCSDVQVAWLGEAGAKLPVQRMRAQVTNIESVSPRIHRIFAWPEYPLQFAAGQYARLGFGDLPMRSYSMANRPDEEVLEFHIRSVPNGVVSEYLATRLKPGGFIRLEGPFGRAHLRPDHDGPILGVAGSSGLAPIKSIIRTALHNGATQPIKLYFGVREEQDVYNEAELIALAARHPNLSLEIVLSAPGGPTRRRTGLLHELVADDLGSLRGMKCYVAGPPPMVEAVAAAAATAGLATGDIHADAFYSSGEAAAAEDRGGLWRLFRRKRASAR